jgi:hypothetical protein
LTGNLLIQKEKDLFSILNFGIEVKVWDSYPKRFSPNQCYGSTSNTLLFARVGLYLLQDFLEFIGLANVDYRDVYGEARNDDHASN